MGGTIGRFILNMYIPASHTNGRSIKHMIGVVVNRLVGMGRRGVESLKIIFLIITLFGSDHWSM